MPFNILAAAVGLIIALTTSQLPDVGALAPPGKNCKRICGGVKNPYPFGLEPDCAMPGFNLYHYNRWFDQRFSTTEIHDSYAALVEASDITFRRATYSAAPFVVDWDIGKVTCDVAQQNPDYACNCSEGFQGNPYLQDPVHGCRGLVFTSAALVEASNIDRDIGIGIGHLRSGFATAYDVAQQNPDYACVSSNSECVNSPSVPGYICNCSEGFHGNPYLRGPDGCQGDFPSNPFGDSIINMTSSNPA